MSLQQLVRWLALIILLVVLVVLLQQVITSA